MEKRQRGEIGGERERELNGLNVDFCDETLRRAGDEGPFAGIWVGGVPVG